MTVCSSAHCCAPVNHVPLFWDDSLLYRAGFLLQSRDEWRWGNETLCCWDPNGPNCACCLPLLILETGCSTLPVLHVHHLTPEVSHVSPTLLTFIFAPCSHNYTFFILLTLHKLQPEVCLSLCATSFTSIPHTFPCVPYELLPFISNFPVPQPWAESLVPASGWHSACSRGKPTGFRGVSCQLPFWCEVGVAAAAALDLGLCVGSHSGQDGLCESLLRFVYGEVRNSLHWKLSMYHSKKAYLPDFTKA